MSVRLDFLGIGAAKAATTTVARLLEDHPEICLSVPKEVRYFNEYNPYFHRNRRNPNFGRSIEWYANHFAHCQKQRVFGEFSPEYLTDPAAPSAIHKLFPNSKLIVCMRNPVDRAYSSYQMNRNYHLAEDRSFSEVIRAEPEYIEKGLYFKHVSRYLKLFDRDQLAFVLFDDIKDRPGDCMRDLYGFLGVDSDFVPERAGLVENAPKQTRFFWLNQLERQMTDKISGWGGTALIQWLKDKGVNKVVHRLNTMQYKYPPMPSSDRDWLRRQFAADVANLEALIGKDLKGWS